MIIIIPFFGGHMKKHIKITIPFSSLASKISCLIMFFATLIRIIYFAPQKTDVSTFIVHVFLPVLASALFLLGMIILKKFCIQLSVSAVAIGVIFFIIKAFSFTLIHQILCTILYITVITIYVLHLMTTFLLLKRETCG